MILNDGAAATIILICLAMLFVFVVGSTASETRSKDYAGKYRSVKDPRRKGKRIAEHRMVAEKILKRPLRRYEVVHHINGKKYDNRKANLCVMPARKHNLLHEQLRRQKRLTGRYPTIAVHKKLLAAEYHGTILSEV